MSRVLPGTRDNDTRFRSECKHNFGTKGTRLQSVNGSHRHYVHAPTKTLWTSRGLPQTPNFEGSPKRLVRNVTCCHTVKVGWKRGRKEVSSSVSNTRRGPKEV